MECTQRITLRLTSDTAADGTLHFAIHIAVLILPVLSVVVCVTLLLSCLPTIRASAPSALLASPAAPLQRASSIRIGLIDSSCRTPVHLLEYVLQRSFRRRVSFTSVFPVGVHRLVQAASVEVRLATLHSRFKQSQALSAHLDSLA